MLDFLATFMSGYKTYIAAAGLLGLAVYQLSQGQYEAAGQTFLAAWAAAGLRSALSKNKIEAAKEVEQVRYDVMDVKSAVRSSTKEVVASVNAEAKSAAAANATSSGMTAPPKLFQ